MKAAALIEFQATRTRAWAGGLAAMANLTEKLKTGWFDHRTDLPQWISIGIGQTAAEWALVEKELEEIIRLLMGTEIEFGRIVSNRMNVRTRIATIKPLIESHILRGALKAADLRRFSRLSKKADAYQYNRDLLAHGLWAKIGKSWFVLQTRQTRPIPELMPTLASLSRATLPQKRKVTKAVMRSHCRQIVAFARRFEAFAKYLERALAPLPHTPPKYTRRRPDYRR